MPGKITSLIKSNFPFLFKEKMPVWLTIVASITAACLTYVFAPIYSRQFQIEDVRSAYLKQTTDQLNSEIIDLSQKVRRFDTALANKDGKSVDLREDCLDLVTKLQWRLVDLRAVLTQPDDEKYVSSLSNSIELLRNKLNAPFSLSYRRDLHESMKNLAFSAKAVLERLYSKTSLQG